MTTNPAHPNPIEVRGACFRTARGTRTKPIELSLKPGELVLLVGPSGSGKSEILRCAIGFSAPLSGEIRMFGKSTDDLYHDDWMEMRRQMAFASESAPFLANLDVMQNLVLPLAMRGTDETFAKDMAAQALERFGLEHIAASRPHQLSREDHRKALLVRAWLLPVALLLLDEPPRDTDRNRKNRWREGLEERRSQGCAILAAAADPSQWSGGVSRMISVIDSGELI